LLDLQFGPDALDFERVVEEEIVTGVIFDDHDVKFEFEAN
jgi:hypothetical protein